jgi:hypothetical protein
MGVILSTYLLLVFLTLFTFLWGIGEVAVELFRKHPGDGIIYGPNPMTEILERSFCKDHPLPISLRDITDLS